MPARSISTRKVTSGLSQTDPVKLRVEALGRRIERLRRAVLEPQVLQGLLPLRARTLPHRSAAPEARERDARFRAVSPAYVAAFAATDTFAAQTRVVDLDGLTWWVPILRPDDEADVQRYLALQDFPYRAITQTREVAVGGVMLDIGGNNGRMAIPRAILGDAQAVYCAEPEPLNYACLVRNVRDNHLSGLVMPDFVAIGAEEGTVRLERARTAGGHSMIDPGTPSARDIVEVPSLTLDAWTARLGIDLAQLAFVKVDVQGSEVHVLRGASRVLACPHVAWQIEVDPALLARRGFEPEALLSILRSHFTHLIDLNRQVEGRRVRPVAEIADALAYVLGRKGGRTDLLLFTSVREGGVGEHT